MNRLDPVPFQITKEHRRFSEFCDACRRYKYIGLCFGAPGVGKTLSARYYAHWDFVEPLIHTHFRMVGPSGKYLPLPRKLETCHTLFYTTPISVSAGRIEQDVKYLHGNLNRMIDEVIPKEENELPSWPHIPNHVNLIIVDKTERAKMSGLEQLRDFYDRLNVGLVLIGMRGLEKQVARHPQLYSRVGFVHEFRPLSADETRFILEHKWQELGTTFDHNDFTDREAAATVIRITGGNFRLIHRLCSQVARLMEINETKTITKELAEAARESLIIGSV